LGFRALGLGLRAQGVKFRVRVQALDFRAHG